MRISVIEILKTIGVPCSPSVVAQYAAAFRIGDFKPSSFSSLRRDEERAEERASSNEGRELLSSRSTWIVPALKTESLQRFPSLIALSIWEDERRLVARHSQQVHQLRSIIALVRELERLDRHDHRGRTRLRRLIAKLADSSFSLTNLGSKFITREMEIERLVDLARKELHRIEEADFRERQEAALRLRKLPHSDQLFGRGTEDRRRGGPSSPVR